MKYAVIFLAVAAILGVGAGFVIADPATDQSDPFDDEVEPALNATYTINDTDNSPALPAKPQSPPAPDYQPWFGYPVTVKGSPLSGPDWSQTWPIPPNNITFTFSLRYRYGGPAIGYAWFVTYYYPSNGLGVIITFLGPTTQGDPTGGNGNAGYTYNQISPVLPPGVTSTVLVK